MNVRRRDLEIEEEMRGTGGVTWLVVGKLLGARRGGKGGRGEDERGKGGDQ